MRYPIVIPMILLGVLLAASPVAFAQASQAPTWLPCAQCMSDEATAEAREATAELPFDVRNLTGVWGPKPGGNGS